MPQMPRRHRTWPPSSSLSPMARSWSKGSSLSWSKLWQVDKRSRSLSFWWATFIYLFFKVLYIFREGERKDKEREGNMMCEKHQCGCLSHTPNWGPGLQPRLVPWLGIELAIFRSAGWCSVYWAPKAKAQWAIFKQTVLSRLSRDVPMYPRELFPFVNVVAGLVTTIFFLVLWFVVI